MWTNKNPFLQGPYEPLVNEFQIENVHVEGEIPRELNGALYRTGGNQHFKPMNPDQFHWFDGDGMVHAFFLRDGKASYANRLVETDGLKVERSVGHALYNGILGGSGQPQPELPEGAPLIKSVAGINVIKLAGKVLTMHEVDSFYYEIDAHNLDTLGKFDFGGQFKGMITAHSHQDHKTGETLFFSLDNERKELEYFSTNQQGEIVCRQKTAMPITPWCHDFTFTEDFCVFFFGPISFFPRSKDYVPKGKSAWLFDDKAVNGKVLLIHRKTGQTRWFDIGPYTVGHYLNSYQIDDKIIVDATVQNLINIRPGIRPENFFPFPLVDEPSPFSDPELWRIVIDLKTGNITHDRLGDFSAEFVRPNELFYGRKHRYGYMAGVNNRRGDSKGFNCTIKYDYLTGASYFQYLNPDYDMLPGEPIFVPKKGATVEDDGYVLQVWYDPARNASEMVILAADDFDGAPLARIKLDHHVPLGFHGNWIAD
ncbi:carotenoid oxygenase family protein [Flavobacterium salmonis]|uniref:Carotenoid cleavage oxygenase n=1 Tax=Flavobacterium salmonis TaxID=2654844 RepID=A0A6V6Z6A2_9FLAO|nr:carotenoid oxygenase family protein [Flavobacterium salmonis]CAD0007175.1 Carotenoid cleavage oxygenase [Flavobacterium salmonis]